jgi:hypothetical protein
LNTRENSYAGNAGEMGTIQADIDWREIGGYDQRITMVKGEIVKITCTCMHTTIEMGRHKLYRDRKPCKHIKEILNESGGKK